jgi:hypothetical protein
LFAPEQKLVDQLKKAILLVSGAAAQKLMMQLEQEQEILMHLADMAIAVFHSESALLRVQKQTAREGEEKTRLQLDIVRTYLYDSADLVNKHGKDALNAFGSGDELRMMLLGLRRFTKAEPFNSKDARRRIAAKLLDAGKYCF